MTATRKLAAKVGKAAPLRVRMIARPKPGVTIPPTALLADVRALIEAARRAAALTVNMAQTQLYWRLGKRMPEEALGTRRAQYGKEIVATLSRQLVVIRMEAWA